MSDPAESELRSAFATRVQTLSPDMEARLRAVDYRSCARRRRRVWAATGAGGTALTGGVVAAVLMLTSGASIAQGGRLCRAHPRGRRSRPAIPRRTTSTATRRKPAYRTASTPTRALRRTTEFWVSTLRQVPINSSIPQGRRPSSWLPRLRPGRGCAGTGGQRRLGCCVRVLRRKHSRRDSSERLVFRLVAGRCLANVSEGHDQLNDEHLADVRKRL